MKIIVDKHIYSDACISNTLYWLGGKYTCIRTANGPYSEEISIEAMDVSTKDLFIENEFWASLNDNKLREDIKKETKDIRTILYLKAFSDCDQITEEELNEL